jgi:hypothetical protein
MPHFELLPASSRPPVANGETVWNVAYGSNLSAKKLSSRAPDGRKPIVPLSQVPVTVPGYKLEFRLGAIPPVEPVMANARRSSDGPQLHGVAYELTKEDYDTLCMSEHCATCNCDPSYCEVPVDAFPYGSRTPISATLFVKAREATCRIGALANSELHERYLHPSARYMTLIRDGARAAGLDDKYQDWLAGMPVARPVSSPVGRQLANLALAGLFLVFQARATQRYAGVVKEAVSPRLVYLYVRREKAAEDGRKVVELLLNVALAAALFPLSILGALNFLFYKARVLLQE